MGLFAVSISTVNIYLSNVVIQVRATSRWRAEKKTKMGKKVTVNKWPVYLFGGKKKTNLYINQKKCGFYIYIFLTWIPVKK